MKLGILTFHCAHNYGAVLQAYGLQEYLRSLGHEVYVIDYRPSYFRHIYKREHPSTTHSNPLQYIKNIITGWLTNGIRNKRFDFFENCITKRLNLYSYKKGMDFHEFDAIFLGSDQIWNAQITGGSYDPVFFGYGAKCNVIAYAASNKSVLLADEEKIFYRRSLSQIENIGVREATLQKLIQPLTGKQVTLTIDPTLLAGKELLDTLTFPIGIDKPYVFVYTIGNHHMVRETADKYAALNGLKVVECTNIVRTNKVGKADMSASPEKFLSYIKESAIVFATSFHGVALSVVFRKNFYYFRQHTNSDIRIDSLLSKIGLTDRMIDYKDLGVTKSVNYDIVEGHLTKLRKESMDFISVALDNCKNTK